jgi:hypothetical protein
MIGVVAIAFVPPMYERSVYACDMDWVISVAPLAIEAPRAPTWRGVGLLLAELYAPAVHVVTLGRNHDSVGESETIDHD